MQIRRWTTICLPDIAFAVKAVSSFSSNPGEAYWRPQTYSEVPDRLKGTKDSSETEEQLNGYSHADWANDPEIGRSVSGYTV